ncbi:MAG TPA: outer membrane beta-barrel domain-containing protein [Burkholderiaceae bacterium]|nr:outer membrane beta-barrel domain-containing protein [Burkholderiaceae bacterium]HQR69883.1 outer membrane beta-barrel domain-containing protein [Burkholderiaceae bacterium]
MRQRLLALSIAAGLASGASSAFAQTAPAGAATNPPANEQVIEPTVPRRDVRVPKIPSNDIIVGAYLGTYSSEDFGASFVYGLRLGYHITEDFFVEGVYGTTKVSDDNYRQILPGGVFPNKTETLDYYNLSVGYNILPGEVFFGRSYAKASALYLIAGLGSTKFLGQSSQTFNFGLGYRVFYKDWGAIQVDFRDHMYSLDLLGQSKSTQNLELTLGATFFF